MQVKKKVQIADYNITLDNLLGYIEQNFVILLQNNYRYLVSVLVTLLNCDNTYQDAFDCINQAIGNYQQAHHQSTWFKTLMLNGWTRKRVGLLIYNQEHAFSCFQGQLSINHLKPVIAFDAANPTTIKVYEIYWKTLQLNRWNFALNPYLEQQFMDWITNINDHIHQTLYTNQPNQIVQTVKTQDTFGINLSLINQTLKGTKHE